MATSKTSKFAALDKIADKIEAVFDKGDAKDDSVGANGSYTFTVADLLANDVNAKASTFFFGDGLDAFKQAKYMADHGITKNADGSYAATAGMDFSYSVLTGKGLCLSYSEGNVDVKDAPAPVPHDGAVLFQENFDTYATSGLDHGTYGTVNLTAGPATGPSVGHSWAIKEGDQWVGVTGEVVQGNLPGSIASTSGDFWLDTQNSPGGIDISNWFVDPTGGEFHLSFDLGIHDFGDGPKAETAQNAALNVLVDGQLVDTIDYSEVLAKAGAVEQMGHFDYVVDGGDASAGHNISFVDVTPQVDGGNYVGFALDTIQVHDWLI